MAATLSADLRLVRDQLWWSREAHHLLHLLDTGERNERVLRDAAAAVLALLPPGDACRYQRTAIARLLAARGLAPAP